MKLPIRTAVLAVLTVGLMTFPLAAAAEHGTRPHTKNIHALGHSPHPAAFLPVPSAQRNVNSDIAFWENYVIHGNYDGFRILQEAPGGPHEISWTHCNGDQGDIVVWENVVVRAWNSAAPPGRFCDGTPVTPGFEGMHIFDISDPEDPVLVGDVELSARPGADSPGCGTHTLTAVPDLANNRLVIYNATSGGNPNLPPEDRLCDWIDIVQVPLANPGAASHLRREPVAGEHAVHDNGVILGNVNLLAAASGHMANVFSIGPPRGGTYEDPLFLYTIEEPGVCNVGDPVLCNGNWHSAGFSWDGQKIILGWEPGGGTQPECQSTDPPVKKSAFFYNAATGMKLGQWTLPRPQDGPGENCTIHNYNTVPLRDGRDILVLGNYQAGTWVVDFTNAASPQTVAWSDPPPLSPPDLGGAWSTYWYNGFLWESEITKGMNVFRVSGGEGDAGMRFRPLEPAIILDHLNPQTQEFSLDE